MPLSSPDVSQPLTIRTESGDEHLDLSEFEARVRQGEVSPQSLVRFPAVTGERFVPACELQLFRSLQEPKRANFSRHFTIAQFPWLTTAVILVNLVVYFLSVQQGPVDIDAMVRFGGKVGPLVTDLGEAWRLLTANFLHRDALHVGLNMFVLFNVGATLEAAYRRLDYLWLLVASGIATMTVSLFLSDAVSLGASGMVFGCLGGVVVFGLKYRSILPSRYRRVLGEAAIPTVLGFLLIGLTSAGVDNWAHLGGLGAGLVNGAFMRPRLLADRPTSWLSPALRAAPSLALLTLVVFAQPLFGDQLPVVRMERDDPFGIAVPIPRDWRRGANRLGQLAYYNGLPGLGRATFAAEALQADVSSDPHAIAERFTSETLKPQTLGPDVLTVSAEPPVPSRVAERDALLVRATFEEPFGQTRLLAYFVPRGEVVYQLVFSYPAAFPRYGGVVDQIVAGIRFEEPKALREARGRALLFPNTAWSMGMLGEALRSSGEAYPAVEALRAAIGSEPSDAALRVQLALALLQSGQVEAACEASRAAVLYSPRDAAALEVDARCELARGNAPQALKRLEEAVAVAPANERLRQAQGKLRAALKHAGAVESAP